MKYSDTPSKGVTLTHFRPMSMKSRLWTYIDRAHNRSVTIDLSVKLTFLSQFLKCVTFIYLDQSQQLGFHPIYNIFSCECYITCQIWFSHMLSKQQFADKVDRLYDETWIRARSINLIIGSKQRFSCHQQSNSLPLVFSHLDLLDHYTQPPSEVHINLFHVPIKRSCFLAWRWQAYNVTYHCVTCGRYQYLCIKALPPPFLT